MKIGLYFGSFNPVHVGHLIIANFITNTKLVDQVWFVVSPHNPLKKSSTLLNEYHRLHLVNMSVDGSALLKVSDVEFKLPRPSYTTDTLAYLKEKYPKYSFTIIIGSDSYLNLPKWKNADKLLMDNKFLVYTRPGFITNDILPQNVNKVNAPLLDISSTYIRDLIKKGLSIRYLVPDVVLNEIENNGYYK